MGACTITMKICLGVISFVFWAVAGGFFFVGGYVYNTYDDFDNFTKSNLILIPATIMLAVGVIMFIVGCCGFLAACKESRFVLACFFSMVLLVLLMEVTVAVLAFAFSYTQKLENTVKDGLEDALHNYYRNDSQGAKKEMDYVQKTLECCGVTNSSDWTDAGEKIPRSCYMNATAVYDKGCETKLEDIFKENLKYIAVVAISFAVLQILGLVCACVLFRKYRGPDAPYSSLSTRDGLTV